MGSHLLEIINKNIDFQKNYIEFELLDTNFSNFAKYISPNIITFENEKNGAELSATALTEWYNEQIETDARLTTYENEISAYAATISMTVIFEKLDYPENFKEQIAAEQIANYEVLKFLIDRELDIRKRMIIIIEELRAVASKKIEQIFGEGQYLEQYSYKLVALHPGGQYAITYKVEAFKIGNDDSHGEPIFRYDLHLHIMKFSNKYMVFHIEQDTVIDTINDLQYINSLNYPSSATFSENWQKANIQLTNGTMKMDFGRFGIVKPAVWYGIKLEDII